MKLKALFYTGLVIATIFTFSFLIIDKVGATSSYDSFFSTRLISTLNVPCNLDNTTVNWDSKLQAILDDSGASTNPYGDVGVFQIGDTISVVYSVNNDTWASRFVNWGSTYFEIMPSTYTYTSTEPLHVKEYKPQYNINNSGTCDPALTYSVSITNNSWAPEPTNLKILYSTFNHQYPAGYEGLTINSNPPVITPPTIDVSYQPNMKISGTRTQFNATYNGFVVTPQYDLPSLDSLSWAIQDDSQTDTLSPTGYKLYCQVYGFSLSDIYSNTSCFETDKAPFSDTHNYSIIMGISLGIATQDSFEYNGNVFNITYKMSKFSLPFKDEAYTLDTKYCTQGTILGDYGFGQNCLTPVLQTNDCTTGDIGCYIGNFFIILSDWIKTIIVYIFVPDKDQLSTMLRSFTINSNGLESVVTAPLVFITQITTNSCQPVTLPLPFLDSNMELPCMTTIYQDKFPTLLALYQSIVIGIVSYWTIISYLRYFKTAHEIHKNDTIEVFDL